MNYQAMDDFVKEFWLVCPRPRRQVMVSAPFRLIRPSHTLAREEAHRARQLNPAGRSSLSPPIHNRRTSRARFSNILRPRFHIANPRAEMRRNANAPPRRVALVTLLRLVMPVVVTKIRNTGKLCVIGEMTSTAGWQWSLGESITRFDQDYIADPQAAFTGQRFAIARPSESEDSIGGEVSQPGRCTTVNRAAPEVGHASPRDDVADRSAVRRPADEGVFGERHWLDHRRLAAVKRNNRELVFKRFFGSSAILVKASVTCRMDGVMQLLLNSVNSDKSFSL
jgi:hypothetical protein